MDSNLCMLKYYKKHIFLLKDMLDKLEPSSDDFAPLLYMQKYIINRILDSERKINKKKKELVKLKKSLRCKENSKESSKEIKSKIKKENDSINGYKYLLYLWRCFGDGIAFKYISKWNLKRLFFESDSPDIKQPSGFVGGKSGMKIEWSLVENAALHKVPSILCDLTNTIRHGDVCLLGANDPHVIEVKSSKNGNNRIARQIESINNIHSYLGNDEGTIGGIEGMHRIEMPLKEQNHNASINEVIVAARNGATTRLNPEPGLYYIGFNVRENVDHDELLKGINEPIIYMLNQAKTGKRWDNYYPFTLSIKTPESLYSFINGEVYLIVVLDGTVMKALSKKIGYDLDIVMSEDSGFVFTKSMKGFGEPFLGIASEHYVGRLGLEFISLEWFFQKEKYMLEEIEKNFFEQSQNA